MLSDIDHRDTSALKGLAITAIVFHNYFHAFGPVHQNEFTFDPARFPVFLEAVRHPSLAIQALFTFFGHFGVQVFIFLSAYGLAKSYWDTPADWMTFMGGRIRKLYPAFGLVVIPWAIAACIQQGPLKVLREAGLELALMPLGLSTFVPGRGLPPVGPWWFIPFIIQLYGIWFVLRKLTGRFGRAGLVVLSIACLAVTYWMNPVLARWSINLLETPIGRMPNICFGIAAARYSIRIQGGVALIAGCVLLLGSAHAMIWPFTFMAALMVALWGYMRWRERLRGNWLLGRIGHYSMFIFLVNGMVRDQFVQLARSVTSQLALGFASAAISFLVAATIQELLWGRRMSVSAPGLSVAR